MKTFVYESFMNRKEYYDVYEEGLTYRRDDSPPKNIKWEDVKYIEDRSGKRVDIFLDNESPLQLQYGTDELPLLVEFNMF